MKKLYAFLFASFFLVAGSALWVKQVNAQLGPHFSAWPNHVMGWEWPVGASVTLTVDDLATEPNPDYTDTQTAETCPYNPVSCTEFSSSELYELGLHPGFLVTMTDGLTFKELTVSLLTATGSNPDADTVFGTADPGAQVYLWPCIAGNCGDEQYSRLVTTDSSGNWTAHFADSLEGQVYDVQRFDVFQIRITDGDYDDTALSWGIPTPFLAANLTENKVYGYAWEMGSSVTLEIDDPNTPEPVDYADSTTVTESWWEEGQVAFDLGDFTLAPGQTVNLSDAYIIRSHEVISNLSVTSVGVDNDIITGTAEPGSLVLIGEMCWYRNCSQAEATADENGYWEVIFPMDITPESSSKAWVLDDDGDLTEVVWSADQLTLQEAIEELIADVDELNLPFARKRLLKAELNLAIRFLDEGRVPAAKLSLYTFIWHVNRMERLGLLSDEVANGLVSSAQEIIASI